MSGPLAEQVLRGIDRAGLLYERLILVVAPAGSGKTAALLDVADRTGYRYVNVNLDFGELLLEMPMGDRPLKAPRLLDRMVDEAETPLLLDNMELLFDASLQLQPFNWLRRVSRNRTVVATWNGAVEHGHVTYAEDGHPERRREPIGDVVVVTPGERA